MVTGIILAGGKSSRMGTEKGWVMLNGKPLIEYAIGSLLPVCDQIIISSNSKSYRAFGYEVVPDTLQNMGPLAGIIAGLEHSENEKNIVLSCDMPFVSAAFLQHLLKVSEGCEITVPWMGGKHFEPLCACYKRSVLQPMLHFVAQGNSRLPDLFQQIACNKLTISQNEPFYSPYLFTNVNSKTELEWAEKLINQRV